VFYRGVNRVCINARKPLNADFVARRMTAIKCPRLVWDQGVAGSNPVAPTTKNSTTTGVFSSCGCFFLWLEGSRPHPRDFSRELGR